MLTTLDSGRDLPPCLPSVSLPSISIFYSDIKHRITSLTHSYKLLPLCPMDRHSLHLSVCPYLPWIRLCFQTPPVSHASVGLQSVPSRSGPTPTLLGDRSLVEGPETGDLQFVTKPLCYSCVLPGIKKRDGRRMTGVVERRGWKGDKNLLSVLVGKPNRLFLWIRVSFHYTSPSVPFDHRCGPVLGERRRRDTLPMTEEREEYGRGVEGICFPKDMKN